MKNNCYQLAIVGYGGIAGWHKDLITGQTTKKRKNFAYGGIDRLEIAGIYDIAKARCDAAKAEGLYVYSSLQEILSDEAVDIVLCATPNHVHKEIVIATLQAGKVAISEKPVSLSSADLQEMIDVANSTGSLFTVHQNRRWDSDYLTIKKLYEEKTVGDVFEIESRIHGSRGIPGDWRAKKEFGGGMVYDWGVHIIDQILMMIDSKTTSIYATLQNVTNDEVDDGFKATVTFENGIKVIFDVATLNFIELPRWRLLGKNGSASIARFSSDCNMVHLTDTTKNDAVPVVTAAGLTKTMAPRTKETTKQETIPLVESNIKDFYNNIIATLDGTETPLITHQQLMRCMKVMEAIFMAAEQEKILHISL